MDNIKVNGNIYAWTYSNSEPDGDFVLFARTRDGNVRMVIEIEKDECLELLEALKEHLGDAVKE